MTRVNLVPVQELMDQHLMAEYRELAMVPAALRRSLRTRSKASVLQGIPKQFTLGKGHVSFFYDKLEYLTSRYNELRIELALRRFNLDPSRQLGTHDLPAEFFNDYLPTEAALCIIRERISSRIALKPAWYRKTPASDL